MKIVGLLLAAVSINGLILLISLLKAGFGNFENENLVRNTQATTFLRVISEFMLYFQVSKFNYAKWSAIASKLNYKLE